MNAYVADFDTIYTKEFEPFYWERCRMIAQERIEDILEDNIPPALVGVNTIGTEQPYDSMIIYYYILRELCRDLSYEHSDMLGLGDSILWNATNGIYHVCGWERLHIDSYLDDTAINGDFQTDIMLHTQDFATTLHELWSSPRDFFSQIHEYHKKHCQRIKNLVLS